MAAIATPAPDPLELENQLCFAVYSTAHAFVRTYRPILERLGLTYPQYLVLLVLWRHDGTGIKRLGERLHLDSGTLTPLVKRLEVRGLVARVRDTTDERQVHVHLTGAGRALRAKAKAIPQRIWAATGCNHTQLDALMKEIVAVRDTLNAQGDP